MPKLSTNNFKLSGEVTLSQEELICYHCKLDNHLVYLRDIFNADVYTGCVDCLIGKVDKLSKLTETDEVKCICAHNISWGCKCGSFLREKYLKSIDKK